MKKHPKKKQDEAVEPKPEVAIAASIKIVSAPLPMPPEIMFREADAEPDQNFLEEYVPSIHVLRQKGFSYREIAGWLTKRGLDVDHNEVYRMYRMWGARKGMTESDEKEDDYRSHLEEQDGR